MPKLVRQLSFKKRAPNSLEESAEIRRLLNERILQMELFSEQICEEEDDAVRYVLRKNQAEAARERHLLEDKTGLSLARNVFSWKHNAIMKRKLLRVIVAQNPSFLRTPLGFIDFITR